MEKRQNTWIIKLDDAMKLLSQRVEGLTWEALVGKPDFVDVFLRASQAAGRTHREEKLEGLRNAVLNSAVHSDLSGDKQMMFVSYLEDLTPSHLKVLTLLSAPREWFTAHNKEGTIKPDPLECEGLSFTMVEFIGYCFSELKDEPEMCGALVQDLITRSLVKEEVANPDTLCLFHGEIVNPNSAHALCADFAKARRQLLKKLGGEFLVYITSPLIDETLPAGSVD